MSGEIGYGAELAYADTQNGTYTEVSLVTEIIHPAIEVTEVDKTHLLSASYFREFTPGLGNAGEIEFGVLFTAAQASSLYALIRTEKWWRLEFVLATGESAQSNWKCAGFLKAIQTMVPLEDKMETRIKIKLTGKPVWTSGS